MGPMPLDLNDEETEALVRLLSKAIDEDRYPLSPGVQTSRVILGKLPPEPEREPPAAEGLGTPSKTATGAAWVISNDPLH